MHKVGIRFYPQCTATGWLAVGKAKNCNHRTFKEVQPVTSEGLAMPSVQCEQSNPRILFGFKAKAGTRKGQGKARPGEAGQGKTGPRQGMRTIKPRRLFGFKVMAWPGESGQGGGQGQGRVCEQSRPGDCSRSRTGQDEAWRGRSRQARVKAGPRTWRGPARRGGARLGDKDKAGTGRGQGRGEARLGQAGLARTWHGHGSGKRFFSGMPHHK